MDIGSAKSKSFARRGVVLAALVLAAPAWAAQAFDRIVVFGTSLSDPGNFFSLTHRNNTPPAYLVDANRVPNAAYAVGGHHLSNGPTWIEQFALSLGLPVEPAFTGLDGATNYAVNRARAWNSDVRVNGIDVSLSAQVGRFLQHVGHVAPPDALYVVEMGSNDVRDALEAFAFGGDGGVIMSDALTAIGARLQDLYLAGARRFLILNVPDIALTPAVRQLDSQFPGAGIALLASGLSRNFSSQLGNIADALAAQVGSGGSVKTLDVFTKVHEIVDDPGAFGLVNVTQTCIMPNVPPFTCLNPAQYLFWDGIHPTKAGHAIIAQQAAGVPGL